MTRRGVEITDATGNTDRMVFTQNECAAWLRKFADRLKFEELTKEEALSGFRLGQRSTLERTRSASIRLLARLGVGKDEVQRNYHMQHLPL